ncbi:MAG: DoxX family protein [Bacteroidales bacterium]|jgi:hypothetical protein|nr:DoxX family protein [Bacteroidales bacterium]
MKIIAALSRILLGCVFIFSGFVKGVDPLGYTYKITDYFTAFDVSFLSPLAFPLSVLLCAAEFVIGMALTLRLRMKLSAWAVLLFMCFFTVLTFILALTNPVTDCGCFGDALILTNWETFFKNILLLAMAVVVFTRRKKYEPVYRPLIEWICVAVIAALMAGISAYGYHHLPLLDFRPYSVGADIPRGMSVPEGAPSDEFKITLYYEKDGVVKAFDEQDYPWNDSTWVWKDTRSELVRKGYQPPIHDFSIVTVDTETDITEEVLSSEGYTFLLAAYRLDKSDREAFGKADEIAKFCRENGYGFYCLTSSLREEIEAVKTELGLSFDFCFTDGITLKTIIRSNPGLVLIRNGTVLAKWHHNDMPSAKELPANLLAFALQQHADTADRRLIYLLLSVMILAVYAFFEFRSKP